MMMTMMMSGFVERVINSIGPRFSVTCSNINTADGSPISWCNNISYILGIYLKTHIVFRCYYNHANTIVFIKHSTPYLIRLAVWRQKKYCAAAKK